MMQEEVNMWNLGENRKRKTEKLCDKKWEQNKNRQGFENKTIYFCANKNLNKQKILTFFQCLRAHRRTERSTTLRNAA